MRAITKCVILVFEGTHTYKGADALSSFFGGGGGDMLETFGLGTWAKPLGPFVAVQGLGQSFGLRVEGLGVRGLGFRV